VFECKVADENKKNYTARDWVVELNKAFDGNFGLLGVPQHGCITFFRTEQEVRIEVYFWMEETDVTTIHDLIKNGDYDTIRSKLRELGLEIVREYIAGTEL